jgi:hypothetical protein
MRKQTSVKRGGKPSTGANEQSKYLSLSRQTYKPYLKDESEDEGSSETCDPDQIIKLAY